jgi:hypothetical protein
VRRVEHHLIVLLGADLANLVNAEALLAPQTAVVYQCDGCARASSSNSVTSPRNAAGWALSATPDRLEKPVCNLLRLDAGSQHVDPDTGRTAAPHAFPPGEKSVE